MSPRTEKQRLEDILERIERIKFAETALLEAQEDREKAAVASDAILYNLTVIGEVVKALGVELKERNGKTPWKDSMERHSGYARHTHPSVLSC